MNKRLFFSATQRNKECIAEVLSRFLPQNGSILEIGSGSGEHGVFFQQRFPSLNWQTSDPELFHRKSISAWIDHYGLGSRMLQPIDLNVEKRPWLLTPTLLKELEGVVCINMIHIVPWTCTKALFEESGDLLRQDQLLFLYGPFKAEGTQTSQSNLLFDKSLKHQNELWGIRDLEAVTLVAANNGFKLRFAIQMPASNLSIIYRKT